MTELEFLNTKYLESILQQIPSLAQKDVEYQIYGSDRKWSRTIYVRFFVRRGYKITHGQTMRISNHRRKQNYQRQFIVNEEAEITQHRIELLKKTIQNCIELTKIKVLHFAFKEINKRKADKNENN